MCNAPLGGADLKAASYGRGFFTDPSDVLFCEINIVFEGYRQNPHLLHIYSILTAYSAKMMGVQYK